MQSDELVDLKSSYEESKATEEYTVATELMDLEPSCVKKEIVEEDRVVAELVYLKSSCEKSEIVEEDGVATEFVYLESSCIKNEVVEQDKVLAEIVYLESSCEKSKIVEEDGVVAELVYSESPCEESSILEEDTVAAKVPFNFECIECGKTFSNNSNLCRHARLRHGASGFSIKKSIKCPSCHEEFSLKSHLEEHLEKQHNIPLQKEKHSFENESEFMEWKRNIEEENVCKFVKKNGSRKNALGAKLNYFYCHRSGNERRRGLQQTKKIASKKLSYTCPAMMRVEETEDKVLVEYTKNHIGHNDVKKLRLTKENKLSSTKSPKKNTVSIILDDINNNFSTEVKYEHIE